MMYSLVPGVWIWAAGGGIILPTTQQYDIVYYATTRNVNFELHGVTRGARK